MSLSQSNAGEKTSLTPRINPPNGPPPSYTPNDPNSDDTPPSASLRELHFGPSGLQESVNPVSVGPVTTDQCIAHLKLLAALADLRETISAIDGLFNLHDTEYEKYQTEESRLKAARLIREKRWAVYVGRAVDRFSTWHERCIRSDGFGSNMGAVTIYDMTSPGGLSSSVAWNGTINWTADMMPPLDVLMVWHAYMLNPRDFLEDCIRFGKMSFWKTGLPWEVVNSCIDHRTFDYSPPPEAAANFKMKTGLQWDGNHDSPSKTLSCPQCLNQVIVPWQIENPHIGSLDSPFESCGGFGDKNFRAVCYNCTVTITHKKLRVAKFGHDVRRLVGAGVPMPGTILNRDGMPKDAEDGYRGPYFPNNLIKLVIWRRLLRLVNLHQNPTASMSMVRDFLGECLKDGELLQKVVNGAASKPDIEERIAIRKLMARYWENSSPFALDLVGAVIRQGTFIGKMDNIDWIHSPALESTMNRLITKYIYFFRIICENPEEMAVPTLDVDLAWHTHQLSPYQYFTYSVLHAKDRFINHDDKVAEIKLTSAFKWTSKQYQRMTGGQIYSECTCWYCEAIRESHNGGIFKSSSTAQAQKRGDQLHSRSDINLDPLKSPHISTHSAVNPMDDPSKRVNAREVAALKLQWKYKKAMRRIRKHSSKSVLTRGGGDSAAKRLSLQSGTDSTRGNPYAATAIVWGLPVALALYIPFAVDPCINTHLYPCNPSCMSMGLDAAGNCVPSTCTAEVAAGVCGWGADSGGACGDGGGCGGCGGE
ncbi:hypothetical protein AJ78_04636 [Emergomyces pasteurianus Ep9510]|uniref:Uncharacterized protein n=1 Tax=Emergomyces pasteurianus Ep9510 TaxID=1447872 RepID=A0A1J9PF08_9EURO|nr:hypothetical protein AJ78_04636 [Emergomyces pasteurianus Ep9510]